MPAKIIVVGDTSSKELLKLHAVEMIKHLIIVELEKYNSECDERFRMTYEDVLERLNRTKKE